MAARDPELTARNKRIKALSMELKQLLPAALQDSGRDSDLSLHAIYGGKFADYIDIKNEVITSPDHFVSLYLSGFKELAEKHSNSAHRHNFDLLRSSKSIQAYLYKFLQRTFLRKYDALTKKRPTDEEAAMWIGQT